MGDGFFEHLEGVDLVWYVCLTLFCIYVPEKLFLEDVFGCLKPWVNLGFSFS